MSEMAHAENATNPLVTVVFLTFNQTKFVREGLASILAQQYSPIEIIVSDDASTDGTFDTILDVLEHYSGPHCVRVNRNSVNLGLANQVNKAVSMATSNLIVGAAGDDISLPDRVGRIAAAYRAADTKYFYASSDAWMIDVNGHVSRETLIGSARPDCLNSHVSGKAMPLGATGAFTKALFSFFGDLPEDVWNEDFVLPMRAHLAGRVAYLNIPLVKYRIGAGSLSQVCDTSSVRDSLLRRAAYCRRQKTAVACMLKDLKHYRTHAMNAGLLAPPPGLERKLLQRAARLSTIATFNAHRANGRRIQAAAILLRTPQLLISGVAEKVGRMMHSLVYRR